MKYNELAEKHKLEYAGIIRKRLLDLCKEKEISINHLSHIAGLNQSTVNNIINGASKNPSIVTIHRIANAISMTPSEFLDFPELNEYEFED